MKPNERIHDLLSVNGWGRKLLQMSLMVGLWLLYGPICAQAGSNQELIRISLPSSGKFKALLEKMFASSQIRIDCEKEIEDKFIKVNVLNASYLKSLDALCRTHGGVTYLDSDGNETPHPNFILKEKKWQDYPSCYSGPFKVYVSGWLQATSQMPEGKEQYMQVSLQALAPPHQRLLQDRNRDSVRWKARGPKGASLKLDSAHQGFHSGHLRVTDQPYPLHAYFFDCKLKPSINGAIKSFEGVIHTHVSKVEAVTIPLQLKKTVKSGAGTWTVTSIKSLKKMGVYFSRVTLQIALTQDVALHTLFDEVGSYEGCETTWQYLTFSHKDNSIVFDFEGRKPKWLKLLVRKDIKPVIIPFEFTDLSFGSAKRGSGQ